MMLFAGVHSRVVDFRRENHGFGARQTRIAIFRSNNDNVFRVRKTSRNDV